ncbi:hypothetical protein [Sphaerotilus mobilis]|uniref:Uncharacterized protein n=1 Tax=Sphaerotilus mobilis TaxID=47994 RepID=A0A4Q7LSB0_9BURK|nr:hypothetical protein [Sphaerotilus mobilis]RZS57222.1 hypothetical protein EV685_1790 [Sphaerotilus mobilis]
MPLHQYTAEWITREDRIRLRINAGDGQEFRFWLTRHIVAGLMTGARSVAVQVLAREHPPAVAQALHEFRQQSAVLQADFTRAFENQDNLPLGEAAQLVTGVTITQSGEQVTVRLTTESGHEVQLQISEAVLRGWVELLDKLQLHAGWRIDSAQDVQVTVLPDGPAAGQQVH